MARRRKRGRGGRRVSAMSNECRIVNDDGEGGFVNKNKKVMAASKNAVASGNDQTVASIDHRVSPPSSNKLSKLKAPSLPNHKLKKKSGKSMIPPNKKILQLKNQVDNLKQKLAKANQQIAELREKNSNVSPFPRVSSRCSSCIGDLSSAEIEYQQGQNKPKKRKISQAATTKPNPDPLESNQTKRRRISVAEARSGEMQTLSLITSSDTYYTCLGNYDPINDEPVSKNTNLEIPSYRVEKLSASRSAKYKENMSDEIFQKRHYKLERNERIREKRDLQQMKESMRVEYLKQGRNKHHSQKSNDNNKEEFKTFLPSPSNIKVIQITNELPVSAFGVNLYDLNC